MTITLLVLKSYCVKLSSTFQSVVKNTALKEEVKILNFTTNLMHKIVKDDKKNVTYI